MKIEMRDGKWISIIGDFGKIKSILESAIRVINEAEIELERSPYSSRSPEYERKLVDYHIYRLLIRQREILDVTDKILEKIGKENKNEEST